MITIIGGGIGGLYLAWRLIHDNIYDPKTITILEQTKRVGGCIYTYSFDDDTKYEAGAGRINIKHKHVNYFIRQFGLTKVPITNTKEYVKDGQIDHKYDELLKQSLDTLNKQFHKKLHKLSFFAALSELFPLPICRDIIDSFGYSVDFECVNAQSALYSFNRELYPNQTGFFAVRGGLTQIVSKLESFLVNKGCVIRKQCKVDDITKNGDKFELHMNNKRIMIDHKLVICIPLQSLRSFSILQSCSFMKAVGTQSLNRIYALIPKYKTWVNGNPNKITTSDSLVKYIIPIDMESGLIMISYTDGRFAQYWNEISNCGQQYLKKRMCIALQNLFTNETIHINDIKYIKSHYWDNCVHFWKPGYDIHKESEKSLNPFRNLYIATETFSLNHGWIEGSMQQIDRVLKKIR